MKPESEWFRPPTWLDNLARRGDWRIFCIIAEPEFRQGTYGVYYEVSEDLMLVTPFGVLEMLKKAAEGELRRRIESGDPQYKKGEGQMFEVFRWTPVIVRTMSGRVTVRTDHEYVLIDPVLSTGPTLTTGNFLGGALEGNFQRTDNDDSGKVGP